MKKKLPLLIGITLVIMGSIILLPISDNTDKNALKRPVAPGSNLAGKKVTVLTNQPHIRSAEAAGKWFNQETGVVVQNIVVNYADILNYTMNDASSDNPQLDIIMVWYPDLAVLVENRAIADLTDFIEENSSSLHVYDFIPSIYDPYTLYKGRRWGIPYDGDTHVLFYRKSIFKKYNLSPPETWDDYLRIGKLITEKEKVSGIYGMAIMAPRIPIIMISAFMNRVGGYGGRLLDEKGIPVVNCEENVAALTAMTEHAKYALPTPLETDWEVARDAFLSGRVAMAEQWTDLGIMAEDPAQSIIQGDWDVIQMPRGTGEKATHSPALNAGYCLSVSSKAPNIETARAYLLFISRPDITLRLNLINGGIDPVRISVLKSPEYRQFAPKVSAAVQTALSRATAWPVLPQTPTLLKTLTNNIAMALEGHKTPREALDKTQMEWLTELGIEEVRNEK